MYTQGLDYRCFFDELAVESPDNMPYRRLKEFIRHFRDGEMSRRAIAIWSIQEWAARDDRISQVAMEESTSGSASNKCHLVLTVGLQVSSAARNEMLTNELLHRWKCEIYEIIPQQVSVALQLHDAESDVENAGGFSKRLIYDANTSVRLRHAETDY